MAGYAADVNECCGRTLFLRVSRTRAGHMLLLIPKEEHKKEKSQASFFDSRKKVKLWAT